MFKKVLILSKKTKFKKGLFFLFLGLKIMFLLGFVKKLKSKEFKVFSSENKNNRAKTNLNLSLIQVNWSGKK